MVISFGKYYKSRILQFIMAGMNMHKNRDDEVGGEKGFNSSIILYHFYIFSHNQHLKNFIAISSHQCKLTHYGLVTPYGDRDLGQHWPRKWLVAWWHQSITWTNVNLPSTRSSCIHSRVIFTWILKISTSTMRWKSTHLKSQSHLKGNELIAPGNSDALSHRGLKKWLTFRSWLI